MKKILKEIFLIILPLAYIAYILYIRLFMVRTPRMLYVKMSYTSIAITLLVIFLLLLRIYYLLKKEGIIKDTNVENKLFLWINTQNIKLYYIILNIWHNLYRIIITKSLKINLLIVGFAKFLYKHVTYNNAIIILVIFEFLPKIILVTTFLFDVFWGQQFYYFYKILFLLLLPLIFSLLRSILLVFHHDNFYMFESYIYEFPCLDNNGESKTCYAFKDDFEPPDFVKDIDDFLENHYFPVKNITLLVACFELIKNKYKINWFFITILLLHLIGWLTILFFGIYV